MGHCWWFVLSKLCIMCCTIKQKTPFYLTKLYAESLCSNIHYFNSAACSQGSEPGEPLERRPLSFPTPELQCDHEHQGPSSPTVWRNISPLKSAIMHKEVTFKINQWKLDFPLALRGWSWKPSDSSSSAAHLRALNQTFIAVVEWSSQ